MMIFVAAALLFAAGRGQPANPSTATQSGCYQYMLRTYGCVPSANNGCNAANYNTANSIQRFPGLGYNTTIPVQAVAGGNGICGPYNTNTTLGVCLWSGSDWLDGSEPTTSGWLNGAQTSNCQKFVYIQKKDQPETIQYARVLDGCSMFIQDPSIGCFKLWMTTQLFSKFTFSNSELNSGKIESLFTWNFDNEFGQHPFNSPI